MTVGTGELHCERQLYSGPIPSNGVVYVENGTCSAVYSPFTTTYPEASGCGNVYVKGDLLGPADDRGRERHRSSTAASTPHDSGEGMLGLIANNFVRIYHPSRRPDDREARTAPRAHSQNLDDRRRDPGDQPLLHRRQLRLRRSLGTLNVNGAIAQKFRGAGRHRAQRITGYIKNYVYDDRLQLPRAAELHRAGPVGLGDRRETID